MTKRIIICLDGTGNGTFETANRTKFYKIVRPTNILKVARAIDCQNSKIDQLTYYDTGVGASPSYTGISNKIFRGIDQTLGGGFGAGIETNVEEAVTFLVNNYNKSDQIFIFGFSRGAATARILCNFIDWCNGLLTKDDAYYIPHFLRTFFAGLKYPYCEVNMPADKRNNQESKAPENRIAFLNNDIRSARISFLGVFDTVFANWRYNKNSNLITEHAPINVDKIVHALAIDEHRTLFSPDIWTQAYSEKDTTQELYQRWFAGVHSNIGGGYSNGGLANCALDWMIFHAAQSGLRVRRKYLNHFKPDPTGVLVESTKGFYKFSNWIVSKVSNENGVRKLSKASFRKDSRVITATIDISAIVRVLAAEDDTPTYKNSDGQIVKNKYLPKNLKDYISDTWQSPIDLLNMLEEQILNEGTRYIFSKEGLWPKNKLNGIITLENIKKKIYS